LLSLTILILSPLGSAQEATRKPLHRTLDLAVGEAQEVELSDGKNVTVKLLELQETREPLCSAIVAPRIKIAAAGREGWVAACNYHLPQKIGPVQIDCPITKGYYDKTNTDFWALKKDARLRVWPAESPLVEPGTFTYPLKQRWFAGDTWMGNEPILVNIPQGKIYYHSGMDIGGSEGMIEVVSASSGLVVAAGKKVLTDPRHRDFLKPLAYRFGRYPGDLYILDDRGWYHWYAHLKLIEVRPGQKVKLGERVGLLGKEDDSGGWSHLHYEIWNRKPTGQAGTENVYPFLWEAYHRQHPPSLVAVAGPIHHQLIAVGQTVTLDASLSTCIQGKIARTEWILTDGTSVAGMTAKKSYERPGTYSEVLKVVDSNGNVAFDFSLIEVVNPKAPQELPPRLNANYAPTFGIQPGDPVTFKVRTWNSKEGKETWDFGDGSPRVDVRSEDNYATTVHRYQKPGHYLVRVERSCEKGMKGMTHLQVRVGEKPR
jgi:murein DD-endopeptidase MepM/ murein hydrolase activator NlpD